MLTYVTTIGRRDALRAELSAAEKRVSDLRADIAAADRALAALDAAGDLAATVCIAAPVMRLSSGWREKSYYDKTRVRASSGGEIGDMFRAVLDALVVGRDAPFVGQCKDYDRWHNQFDGIHAAPSSPRHGYVTWSLRVAPMTDGQREACVAVLRAILGRRITPESYADACDEAAKTVVREVTS